MKSVSRILRLLLAGTIGYICGYMWNATSNPHYSSHTIARFLIVAIFSVFVYAALWAIEFEGQRK